MNRAPERAGPGSRERGWTVLEVLLVLAMVSLLLAIALPNFHATRIRNNEVAAVFSLREIGKAQELFRAAALIDEDSDGRGEFAFLREMSGAKVPRTFVPGSGGGGAPPAPLPQFRFPENAGGEAEVCGYRFTLYLPDAAGKGVPETGGPPEAKPDPRVASRAWCAYARPVRNTGWIPAATGRRTFFANQSGEVLCTEGAYFAEAPKGQVAVAPRSAAAFLRPGPDGTITGAPAMGTVGRDGEVWRAVQ